MAGRGRGRGRGSMSFDISSLGFGKGEVVPSAILQPPPVFPPLEFKPTPLSNTEVDEYLLALKQEFKGAMRDSPYFIKAKQVKKDIVRFSDKYKEAQKPIAEFVPDKRLFPKELIQPTTKKRKVKVNSKPSIPSKRISKENLKKLNGSDTLEILEKIIEEKVVEDNNDEIKEGDEVEEEEYYEEEEEEENDYLVNYYDEGDDDVGMEDDNDGDDGPVY
eukprot:gene9671-10657_t